MYRPRRQHRYDIYKASGFLFREAAPISSIRYVEAPYLRKMIRDRRRIKEAFDKQADALHLTKRQRVLEYRDTIRSIYDLRGWTRNDTFSVWLMLADYRQKAIDRGEYYPPKRKHIRRDGDRIIIHIYKGDVDAQKQRYRQRLKARQEHG